MMAKFAHFSMWIKSTHRFMRRAAVHPSRDRGVALLFALLLLTIMSALGVIMVLTVSPDMMVNGYYGNYRGSFYAADSGMNIARQQLINLTDAQVNMAQCADWQNPLYCNFAPIANPGSAATSAYNSMMTSYSGSFNPLQGGQAANSWPESFQVHDYGSGATACVDSYAPAPNYPLIHHSQGGTDPSQYTYAFNYTLCSLGRAQQGQQVQTKENGVIRITITGGTVGAGSQSFASYGAFINSYPPCLGPLVPGTMTGPMFANTSNGVASAWQFMAGNYIFTDPVSQTNANADYWFGGTCVQSPTTSYTQNGQTIKPQFLGGLQLGQQAKTLPQNSYNQQWAVLDAIGCGEYGTSCGPGNSPPAPTMTLTQAQNATPPQTQPDMQTYGMHKADGTAWPNTGASSGVWFPWTYVNGVPTFGNTGSVPGSVSPAGGFFVQGNASIVMSVGNDGSGNPTQTYAITQGTTTTTVTTNIAANSTTVVQGSTTLTMAGVPQNLLMNQANCANAASGNCAASMLYVNGNITGLKGTAQGAAAVQDNTAVTITAYGDLNVTGDLKYKTEPVSMDVNDTLQTGWQTMNQDLGLFTATGNIVLSSPYSNKNLQVDGSQAALSSNCASSSCGFKVNGCINTFNNVGGQIQYNIFSACMTTENTYYDRRYTARTDGFAPPWFPSTNATPGSGTPQTPQVAGLANRLSWVTTPQ